MGVRRLPLDPAALPDDVLAFLSERHLATLSTLRSDGSPHVVPVGFSYDTGDRTVRVISFASSVKVANARRGGRAAVSQVDGARWLTLEGPVRVADDEDSVAAAVAGYTARYRQPSDREDRVAIEIAVDRIMGRA